MRRLTPAGLILLLVGAVLLLAASGCSEPPAPTPTPTPTLTPTPTSVPALLWEYPLRQVEYPHSSYPVFIDDGVAVVGIRGSELHALDARTGRVLWRRANERGQSWQYRVSEGVVYLSQSREVGQTKVDINTYTVNYSTEVFALDARSGNVIWQYRPEPDRWTDGFLLSEGALAVRSAPYFGLDAETGQLLWEVETEGVTNYASGGVVFVEERIERAQEPRSEFGVSAIDMNTGETLWRQVHSSVDVRGAEDGIVLVGRSPDNSLYGLDAKTGRTIWTHHQGGRSLWPEGAGDGLVIVASKQLHSCPPDYKGICYPEVYPIDEFCVVSMSDGKSLWCEDLQEDDYVTRLGDLVYLTSGKTGRTLDARTGKESWSREGKGGVDGAAPQVRMSRKVFYVNDHGMISALHPATWAVRWQYQLAWDDDTSDWRDNPSIRAVDDDVVVLWTGAGLAAVGLPFPSSGDSPAPSSVPQETCNNGIVVPEPQDNPGLVDDCVVLLSVRGVLVGDDGTLASESVLNWSADLPITQWDGISIVEPGRRPVAYSVGETPPTPRPIGLPDRVRTLNLGSYDLRGQVPAGLADLTGLDMLFLDSPYLTGDIPSELGRLANLEEFRLGSGLTGPIPSELGALANLRFVAIRGSNFSGCLPGSWKREWIMDASGAELGPC